MNRLITSVTDASFDQDVLASNLPVLVFFWAEWNGPSKMEFPILDDIAFESEGKVKITTLNIDDNFKSPSKFGVRGIPTFLIFKYGSLISTKVGAASKQQILKFIDDAILTTS